jgi:S1-C subfamily serine protease
MRRWQVWFFGRSGQILFWSAVVLVGWFLVGPGATRARWWWPFERSGPAVVVAPAAAVPPGGWTAVTKAAMPAVVNIASARTVRGPEGPSAPFFSDPFFRFFSGPEVAPRRERSLRSGVVVTPDGYVLTNNHVNRAGSTAYVVVERGG